MAADALKSLSITGLDTIPIVPQTTGMGAPGRLFIVDDVVGPTTATGLQTAKSSYRLCRFPTIAKIKSVILATDAALDTGTHALVFDINVAFSDSTVDGTPANVQGLIPTTAKTGATTTLAAYSAPNVIFGTSNNTSASVAQARTQLVFNGTTATWSWAAITSQPLWQTFGFVDGAGRPADPGGYFDLFLVNSTVAGTGAAGNIYCSVEYVV
jgi:hypothetical protein